MSGIKVSPASWAYQDVHDLWDVPQLGLWRRAPDEDRNDSDGQQLDILYWREKISQVIIVREPVRNVHSQHQKQIYPTEI